MIKIKGRTLLIFFSVVFQINQVIAQIVVEEELKRRYYDRTRRITNFWDMKDMRDVTHKDKLLMGKRRIYGNLSYNTGRVMIEDADHVVHKEMRNALGIYTRIRFFEEFSFNTTFYIDFNKRAATRWISDYSYSIGRYNWRPNKFNYGYENYVNNKYKDNIKTFGNKFLEGYYFISFGHSLPFGRIKKIGLDSNANLKFTYFARYAIKYRNEFEVTRGGLFEGKPTFGISLRYTFFRNFYIEGATYFYVHPEVQKQPWDPDYTYGFGWFDWRSFRCSLTYGNWAVNRFSWNKTAYPNYGFLDGNFKFAVNYIW